MASFHARSNSLPSRPHPLIAQIHEYLCRQKSNKNASSSSPSITQKLGGIRDVYELVDSLLQLPQTQNSLSQQCNDKQVNDLLDVCGVAKQVLLQAKEDTQKLESISRRRRGDEAGFVNEAKEYLASRKKAKKLINKCLKDLKTKCGLENDVEPTYNRLKEVEGVSFAVLQSVLSYISATKIETKSTNWSLVSKLMMQSKRVSCEGEATEGNDFERVDSVLCSLIGQKSRKCCSIENAQIELQKLESTVQDLEDGVECLLRLLIKTRVSILNILSH